MPQKIYVETSVISYLAARPSRDVVMAGHQQVTREWWENSRGRYELLVSELVVREASGGDPTAARERLEILNQLPQLSATEDAVELAHELVEAGAIPETAAEDALHIAIAVTNGLDYLVTWNFRHIANAVMRSRIEEVCRGAGFEPPIICTPEELLETDAP